MDINTVILGGRLTHSPRTIETTTGTDIVTFSIANNSRRKDANGQSIEMVDFFNEVTAFGPTARAVRDHLQKGSQVVIEGRLAIDVWVDKATDQQRRKTKIIANVVHFGSKPKPADQPQPQQVAPQAAPPETPPTTGEQPAAPPTQEPTTNPTDVPF